LLKVRAQLEQRAATALDLAMAQTQAAQAQADVAHARRLLVDAEARLRDVLNLGAHEPVTVAPLPSPNLVGMTEQDAIARALDQRAELAALSHRSELWNKQDARLKAEAIAPLTLGLDAEKQGNSNPNSSVGASVGFELPAFQRNQGARAVARRHQGEAELELALAERSVARSVVVSMRRLAAALDEVHALETHALPATARTLDMTKTLVAAGAADYFMVLTARERAYSLRTRYVEALRAAWQSRLEVERAVGGLEDEKAVVEASKNGETQHDSGA
jgi:cobalt-zinc-cadmium efflux system outer membrane protein